MLRRVDAEINHCLFVFVQYISHRVCGPAATISVPTCKSFSSTDFFFCSSHTQETGFPRNFFFSRLPPVVFMSLPLLPHFKQVLQQQRDLMKGVITFRNASRDWKAEYSTEIYCVFILNEIWSLFQIVEEEALIKNNNTCKDFLIEAMKYHLLPADQRHLIKTDRTRPRTPISIPKVHAEMCQSWRFLT